MADSKYGIAYSELLEILKYIPREDYNKIPKAKIELFETNADKDYVFNYNPNKSLEDQNVSNITKGIIILLYRDYWATEVQRNKIITKQNYDRMKLEEEKKAKYNIDIFQKNNTYNQENSEKVDMNAVAIIEYKDSIFKRIIAKIKNFFRR